MTQSQRQSTVLVIGGGVVGTAIAFTLAHRGVDTVVVEAESDLGLAASGTNSGILHTGFDSAPGELETDLILRSAKIRPAIMEALEIPVLKCGAVLTPKSQSDQATVYALASNAAANGVEVSIRESDGALEVPGEWVTDPVAYTQALAASAITAGVIFVTDTKIGTVTKTPQGVQAISADGRQFDATYAVNAAGLFADEIARAAGDDSFSIYPRKGEFFVFEPEAGSNLDHVILPVPTKRTKGVLVFPSLDGKIIAGPTAYDQTDKSDWSVRDEASAEILKKAYGQYPELEGLNPEASYAGLRPAGDGCNYLIRASSTIDRLINVAAIRSTGLSASLGIGEYVAEILADSGLFLGDVQLPLKGDRRKLKQRAEITDSPWWLRTARYRESIRITSEESKQ